MTVRRSAAFLAFSETPPVGDVADVGPWVFLGHMGGPFWERRDAGGWSIPKGEYVADEEDPRLAARREFEEEIGVPAPPGDLIDLGDFVQPSRKVIRTFAVAADTSLRFVSSNTFQLEWPRGSGAAHSYPEMDRAGWFNLAEARRKVVKGQVAILDALAAALLAPGPTGAEG